MYIQLTQNRVMQSTMNCTRKSAKYAPAQDSPHLRGALPQGQTYSTNVPANME